jgi:hypothetical protein
MIAVVVLLIIDLIILLLTKEDIRVTEVKRRYKLLREHLKSRDDNDEDFKKIHDEISIIAYHKMTNSIGYNLNKGVEIGLCIDGTVNEIFHVLLHELAHCMVVEYSHSSHFWNKFEKLRDVAVSLGIYTIISDMTPFCGKHVMDK